MPCLVIILALAFPRVVLILMYMFSSYLERAYHNLLLPVLGFIFLPLTTIYYAWMVNNHEPMSGIYLALLIVAVLVDLGILGHGYSRRGA